MKMSLEMEDIRQMSDKEVEEVVQELKTLKTNNDIMKKLLFTIEAINDLLKTKSFRCHCNQSIDTKVETKLNVLNNKYKELKDGLNPIDDNKFKNNLIVIKTDPQKKRQLDSFVDQSVDDFSDNTLNENNESVDTLDVDNNQTFEDPEVGCHQSDESLNQEDNEELVTVFGEMDDCEYCCQFSDSKSHILCQKKFTTRETLLNHVIGHSGPKPWFCEYSDCEYRSVLRSHLIGHIRKSHTARHQFQCDWPGCDFRGPSRYNVKRHKIIHTNEKPYKCDWPGCQFRSPNNKIAEHKRIHTGEKPYLCSWVGCDAKFSRSFTLRNHLRTHTGEKPFKCDYPNCHYSSTQQTPLAAHKRKHHNWSKESSEEVVFSDNIVATDE